jgi:XamI restriction endonuclease
MSNPKKWTLEELKNDADQARAQFRLERIDEPLELYSEFFDTFVPIFAELVDNLGILTQSEDPTHLADLMRSSNKKTAFRYLAAPPISEDDLKVLADTKLSATALKSNPASAQRVREIVLHILDPHRFIWAKEQRQPSQQEREIAIVSSAALVAAKKVETSRRSSARKVQEEAVIAILGELDYVEVPKRAIQLLSQAPNKAEFCGESKLGHTRADLVIRLHDDRVLAVECKASNSEVNSFKRVNHEAAGKAKQWLRDFGSNQIVPSAVLSGVFNINNLLTAQEEGLNLFWSHRLQDLIDFINPV